MLFVVLLLVLVILVVPVVPVMLIVLVVASVGIQVKFLKADGHRRGHRGQAPRALARERRGRGPGGENAFGNRLVPDLEGDVGAFRDADELQAQVVRSGDGPLLGQADPAPRPSRRVSKTSAPRGACVRVLGMTAYSCRANGNRAHSLPAVRGIPNLTVPRRYSFRPTPRPGVRAAGTGRSRGLAR